MPKRRITIWSIFEPDFGNKLNKKDDKEFSETNEEKEELENKNNSPNPNSPLPMENVSTINDTIIPSPSQGIPGNSINQEIQDSAK